MNRPAILHDLQEIFRQQLGNPAIELSLEMETGSLDTWDSFANVEILLECELRWSIRFTAAEIDSLRSVGDLVRAIEVKVAQAA
jgi:acyl carrier protein